MLCSTQKCLLTLSVSVAPRHRGNSSQYTCFWGFVRYDGYASARTTEDLVMHKILLTHHKHKKWAAACTWFVTPPRMLHAYQNVKRIAREMEEIGRLAMMYSVVHNMRTKASNNVICWCNRSTGHETSATCCLLLTANWILKMPHDMKEGTGRRNLRERARKS